MEIDINQPNAARIYDYMLGGSHNFEVDRQAAERIRSIIPSTQNIMRLNRWFMHEAVDRLAQGGFDCFLDLASGLPTEGYVHELVPSARVIYNDRDPITVAYATEILNDNPNVRYLHHDLITDVDAILAAADRFFDGQRRIAVSFVGVAYFLPDETVANILAQLHAWCAPGSQVAISWGVGDMSEPRLQEILALYQRMNSTAHLRTIDQIQAMLRDWTTLEPGLKALHDWVEVGGWELPGTDDQSVADMYGCIIAKA